MDDFFLVLPFVCNVNQYVCSAASAEVRRSRSPQRPKPKCLKCQSTAHRVREHPGITDAEVKKLMDDFHQARRLSVTFVSSTKPANSMECQASIEDVLTLPKVLLDSGSDETLVSEGLLVALEHLGASLNSC
ncbi:hypothetical protein DYB26_014855 [Aphanomyces astaci]|uniref:Uncharacterized protein n=1 Tax=Aphanomyces astaci TaxID=112090 RepID=A0A418E7N2_APHAT|nr:hypothetical protein DYB26_014855 [Aphanomyces astaci]